MTTKLINFNGNMVNVVISKNSFQLYQKDFALIVTPAHTETWDNMDGSFHSVYVPTEFEEWGIIPNWMYSLAGVLEDACYKRS